MRDKIVRLARALMNESVKRLPYIIFVLVILFLVQFIKLNGQTAQSVMIAKNNSVDSKSLLKQVAALSEDNKNLTQQNIELSKEGAEHLDCVAKLFTQYTRDLRPVSNVDLDNCFIQQSARKSSTSSQSGSQPSSVSHVPASSVKPTSPAKSQQSNNSQPIALPTKKPSILDKAVNLFHSVLGLLKP